MKCFLAGGVVLCLLSAYRSDSAPNPPNKLPSIVSLQANPSALNVCSDSHHQHHAGEISTLAWNVTGTSSGMIQATTTTHVKGPRPPHHIIVAQGPTDPVNVYALVTWDRNDIRATAYEVLRDGVIIGTVTIKDDPWDDTLFKDRSVTPGEHAYTVRAISNNGTGQESAPFLIHIRTDADFGKVYDVDSYSGADDSKKIEAAIADATTAGGGVIRFAERTYTLARGIVVIGDKIVLRGAGIDRTILQPSFAGLEGTNACRHPPKIIYFDGAHKALTTTLDALIQPGDRTVKVKDARGLAVGQVILFNETHNELTPKIFQELGVTIDPGTGHDDRYPYESNEIVAINGTAVTFKFPFSCGFSEAAPWRLFARCLHSGIESLTIQGRSSDEQTWYDGVWFTGADNFAADIKVQWTNRRVTQVMGYDVRLVGVQGPFTGHQGYLNGICRYKVQVVKSTNALIIGSTMGRSSDDFNMSLVTIQQSVRAVVRNSVFYRSRSYAVNEHGEGSRHLLVENNYFATGKDAILLGNNTWGFSGPIIIRNNTFEGNTRDIRVTENSYEIRILDNISRGVRQDFVSGFGWAGPFTSADLHGSMRMTIARNQVLGGVGGIALGFIDGVYPYVGVKDVVIVGNTLNVTGTAITLSGINSETNRLQVSKNTGSRIYVKPMLVDGDYWSGNADGKTYGNTTDIPWTAETFAWEEFDCGTTRPHYSTSK